jgi:hypothetical protein
MLQSNNIWTKNAGNLLIKVDLNDCVDSKGRNLSEALNC